MRKVIAIFNMTLDGICDHTAGIPDEEVHQHYTELIDEGGLILYGRTTFQLMQFWQEILKNPSKEKSMNDFAKAIDKIPKIVFSHTLKDVGWESAKLASESLEKEVFLLKNQTGKDILVGSKSLIIQLLNSQLIDELQICVYPVIEGKGMLLFDQINDRIMLKCNKIKLLKSGATIFYYIPILQ